MLEIKAMGLVMFGMSGVASIKWNTTINTKKHINMGQYALRATQQFPFHNSDELIWKYQRSLMPYWTRVEQQGDHRWLLLWIQMIARIEGVHKNEILVGWGANVEPRSTGWNQQVASLTETLNNLIGYDASSTNSLPRFGTNNSHSLQ